MKLDVLIPGAASSDFSGIDVVGITADSRKVKPGFVFAALQGVAKDGRDYIDGAIKSGAVAILTDARPGEWSVPAIRVDEPRLTLAQAAAAFYPTQPGVVAAVTGTNGKSSTVDFLRQIWSSMGRKAASMGTLGAIGPSGSVDLGHTTPDPVAIHATLDKLARESGYDSVEAWSKAFHVWQFDWDEAKMEFRVDGRLLNTVDLTKTINATPDHANPLQEPQAFIVNLAVGGVSGGDPSSTPFPARFEVDWIRVWQPDAADTEDDTD
jgi:hypothetical protein